MKNRRRDGTYKIEPSIELLGLEEASDDSRL